MHCRVLLHSVASVSFISGMLPVRETKNYKKLRKMDLKFLDKEGIIYIDLLCDTIPMCKIDDNHSECFIYLILEGEDTR